MHNLPGVSTLDPQATALPAAQCLLDICPQNLYHILAMGVQISLPDWPLDPIWATASRRDVKVWVVGGAVRDALLGRSIHDWDFAADGDAMGLARAVADELEGAFYPLDAERDTARVILSQEDGRSLDIDFAALRGPDLEADLHGRDFTINAMAAAPDGRLIDPLDGLNDLQAHLVRAIGPEAFDDDPLRMLRAVRVAAVLGMRLEAKTATWIMQRASSLSLVSSERIRDEFMRVLGAPAVAEHVQTLDELGLMVQIVPELDPLREQDQSPPHRFDVWWHTLMVMEALEGVLLALTDGRPRLDYVDAPEHVWDDLSEALGRFAPHLARFLDEKLKGGHSRRTLLLLAALCHDIGKPLTCTEDEEGHLHFYSHGPEGARLVAKRMRALHFSRAEEEWVRIVVRNHLRPAHLARVEGPVTGRAIYRYFRDTQDAGVTIPLLSLADHLSTWGPNLDPQRWERRLEVVEMLLEHYFERREESVAPPPVIGGRDLMEELGLEEGPQIGRLLEAVREAQATGNVQTREEALALARRLSDQ